VGIRLKAHSFNTGGDSNQEPRDLNQENRETTVDGQTFHWAPGQVRNFADDGVGLQHVAQLGSPSIVRQDAIPFGDSRS